MHPELISRWVSSLSQEQREAEQAPAMSSQWSSEPSQSVVGPCPAGPAAFLHPLAFLHPPASCPGVASLACPSASAAEGTPGRPAWLVPVTAPMLSPRGAPVFGEFSERPAFGAS